MSWSLHGPSPRRSQTSLTHELFRLDSETHCLISLTGSEVCIQSLKLRHTRLAPWSSASPARQHQKRVEPIRTSADYRFITEFQGPKFHPLKNDWIRKLKLGEKNMNEKLKVTKTINVSTDKVWAAISGIDGLDRWFPIITSCRVEGEGGRCDTRIGPGRWE